MQTMIYYLDQLKLKNQLELIKVCFLKNIYI